MSESNKPPKISKSDIKNLQLFIQDVLEIKKHSLSQLRNDSFDEDRFIEDNLSRSCPENNQIELFLNNKLGHGERIKIIQHLSGCKTCRIRVKKLVQGKPVMDQGLSHEKNRIPGVRESFEKKLNTIKIKITETGLKLLEASEFFTSQILRPQLALRNGNDDVIGSLIVEEKDIPPYHLRVNMEQRKDDRVYISLIIKEIDNDELVEDCDIEVLGPMGESFVKSSKFGKIEFEAKRIGNYFLASEEWADEKIVIYLDSV